LAHARIQYAVISALATVSPGRFVRVSLVATLIGSIGLVFFFLSSSPAYAANCTEPAPERLGWARDQLFWSYNGSPDCAGTYNLRWTIQGAGDSQIEISGSDHCQLPPHPGELPLHSCVTAFKLEPGRNYGIRVQACDKRTFVESSSCSVWTEPLILPFGQNTCQVGFVWREAIPRDVSGISRDLVCVTPETRQNTANDNAQAAARRNPNGGAFGPDTCLEGFVWREAVPTDHVCVTPATRQQARDDNAQASARVWRP
jgi:hypothetical protein